MSIVTHRKLFLAISSALVVGSVVVILVFGLRLGIDFTGGSLLEVRFPDGAPETSAVNEALEPILESVSVQASEDETFILRFQDVPEETHQEALTALGELGEVEELRFDSIGPTIGAELKRSGLYAVALGLIVIMLYVAWAFRHASRPIASWQYGVITAGVALFHDVLITVGAFALLGKTAGFEANTPFIAALLTVLGYSVNDTIVIFDRVRENLRRMAGEPFSEIVGRSLRQTLARSLNTSLTLLFAVAAVWYFGGTTIRPFALTLFIGVALGTYSSLFLASNLLVVLEGWLARRRA